MSNWDILGGNGGGNDDEEEVEYVGVIEEDAPAVQEPRRAARQTVRRVAPRRMPTDQTFYPVAQNRRHQNGVVGAPNRDMEDLVSYVNMPHGKQLGLTPEAVERLQTTPMTRLNGQMTQRIEPGTYVMYGPSRAGGMGDLFDDIIGTQDRIAAQQGMGTNGGAVSTAAAGGGSPSWLGDLFGAVANLGSGIATAVSSGQASRREAETERLRIEAENEAAASARDIAFQEAQLEHAERIAEIEAGAAELEILRAQTEEAAALRNQAAQAPPVVTGGGGGGSSPVVWIIVGLLGLGAVGGVIWFVSKKKDEDED
jgi:hypothetical protein